MASPRNGPTPGASAVVQRIPVPASRDGQGELPARLQGTGARAHSRRELGSIVDPPRNGDGSTQKDPRRRSTCTDLSLSPASAARAHQERTTRGRGGTPAQGKPEERTPGRIGRSSSAKRGGPFGL